MPLQEERRGSGMVRKGPDGPRVRACRVQRREGRDRRAGQDRVRLARHKGT